jgi:Tfp pilus assembly protein PilF
LNRSSEAAPLLVKATQIAPQAGQARYELGKAYFTLNRFDDARVQIEEAVKLDNSNSANHYLLGRVYQRLGKKDLAAKQFAMTNDLIGKQNSNATGMSTGAR